MKNPAYISKRILSVFNRIEPKIFKLMPSARNISLSLILFCYKVSAAIVDDGLWTGNDWYDDV